MQKIFLIEQDKDQTYNIRKIINKVDAILEYTDNPTNDLAIEYKKNFYSYKPLYTNIIKQLQLHGIKKKDIIMLQCLKLYKKFVKNTKEKEFINHLKKITIPTISSILHIYNFNFYQHFNILLNESFIYGNIYSYTDYDEKSNNVMNTVATIDQILHCANMENNLYNYISLNKEKNILIILSKNKLLNKKIISFSKYFYNIIQF